MNIPEKIEVPSPTASPIVLALKRLAAGVRRIGHRGFHQRAKRSRDYDGAIRLSSRQVLPC